MNECKNAVTKTVIGISAMFGIYWVWLCFIKNSITLPDALETVIGLISLYGIGFAVFFMITKKLPCSSYEKGTVSVKTVLLCFLLQFTALTVLTIIVNISSAVSENEKVPEINALSPYSLFMLIIFNPIIEEIVFRKIFADKLLKYGEGIYMLVSSFCFALVHGVSLGIPQILYTFILGMIWSYLTAKTGDIRLSAVMHSLSNLMGSVMVQLLAGISMMLAGMYSMLMILMGIAGFVLFIVNKEKISIDGKSRIFSKENIKEIFSDKAIWLYMCITAVFIVIKHIYL